ncbi:Uncharacterised protein [Escherichia coli]|nr:Uncharacterised protein [Escherichia coli]
MALTMGVAPTLFIKLNMRIIWVTLLCAWARRKVAVPVQTLFRTPVTQVKVEIGCVKLAVHLRVEFEKHSSGCHT